jgi:hypothetical protein
VRWHPVSVTVCSEGVVGILLQSSYCTVMLPGTFLSSRLPVDDLFLNTTYRSRSEVSEGFSVNLMGCPEVDATRNS